MAYEKQTWVDRETQHPDRRRIEPVDGPDSLYDITREQGDVYTEGTPITAERLNHMENGIFEKQDAITAQNKLPYAYIADTPTVLPNPFPLTFGSKTYDGTVSQSLSPADIGLGTVFNLRGSKASASNLPSSGNTVGDVWYVISEHVGYVWLNDGTVRWEQLGLPIDLSGYAETGGTYPGMTVGHAETAGYADVSEYAAYADQLDSTVALTVSSPFVFRPSGGGADVEGYLGAKAEISAIYGKTLVWNQLCDGTLSRWGKLRVRVTTEDRVTNIAINSTGTSLKYVQFSMTPNHKYLIRGKSLTEVEGFFLGVYDDSGSTYEGGRYWIEPGRTFGYIRSTTQENKSFRICSTTSQTTGIVFHIADLQFFDLTQIFGAGNEPTTANDFQAMFPLSYYAFDAGRLLNFMGTGIQTVGFNALSPDGTAKLLGGKGYEIVGAYSALSYSTGEAIVPVDGIFTPTADGVLTVAGANAGTCVHLMWSGYRNGEYAPYHAETRSLPISAYFPDGMMSLGTMRDELRADRMINRCGERTYREGDESDPTVMTDGVHTVYALDEPVETPIDPPLDMSFTSSDYGTELLLPENGSAPVTTPIYAGIRYVQNLRDKLQRLPVSPATAGLYIVRYDGVKQAYVMVPDIPSSDGVYTLKCEVMSGTATLNWVVES